MSITRKIIDLAKSNLNSLLEKAAETADPRRRMADLSDAELEAELVRRRAARSTEQKIRDAKARVGIGGREAREREAKERVERVKAERAARAAAGARAAGSGPRAAGSAPGSGSGSGSAGGQQRQAPPPRAARDPELKRYYDRLELPPGSSFEEVRTAYRRLMRRYHPDLHVNKSPEKQKAAHEVSAALTQAYNELERAIGGSGAGRK